MLLIESGSEEFMKVKSGGKVWLKWSSIGLIDLTNFRDTILESHWWVIGWAVLYRRESRLLSTLAIILSCRCKWFELKEFGRLRLASGTQSAATCANLEARWRSPQLHVAVLAHDAPLLSGWHFETSAGEVDREATLRTSARAEYFVVIHNVR